MFCDNVVCIIPHHFFPDDVFKAAVLTPQCRYLVLSNAEIILTIVNITLPGAYYLPDGVCTKRTRYIESQNQKHKMPIWWWDSRLILGLHPANERRRYKETPSLIGWAQT